MRNDQEVRGSWVLELPESRRRGPVRRVTRARWLGWLVAVVGALVALLLVQLACRDSVRTVQATPGAPDNKRVIEVDGTARLELPPDRADLSITLEERRATPREAARAVKRKQRALLTALEMAGLRARDMVVSLVDLHPRYTHRGRAIEAYVARVTLIARLAEPDKLSEFVEAAALVGVTRLRTTFRSSRLQEMKKKVRELALRAAREKAEQIARSYGVAVGQLRAVRENRHGNWKGRRWGWGGESNMVSNDFVTIPTSGKLPDKAVRPDAVKLTLSLDVTFAIR